MRGETKVETRARLARESDEMGASLKRSLVDGMTAAGSKKANTSAGGGGVGGGEASGRGLHSPSPHLNLSRFRH